MASKRDMHVNDIGIYYVGSLKAGTDPREVIERSFPGDLLVSFRDEDGGELYYSVPSDTRIKSLKDAFIVAHEMSGRDDHHHRITGKFPNYFLEDVR